MNGRIRERMKKRRVDGYCKERMYGNICECKDVPKIIINVSHFISSTLQGFVFELTAVILINYFRLTDGRTYGNCRS